MKNYFSEFKNLLNEQGIRRGSIVYIASDISALLIDARRKLQLKSKQEQYDYMDTLIDTMQELISPEGTIIMPVYSWDFCRGKTFDYYHTQGEVGVLNNYVLNNRKDFTRTKHPIYSFMVWGKDASYLKGLSNQDAWSNDSPFAYLYHSNAIQLNLSVPLRDCITFQHYIEQCANVPYRYKKYFMGTYKSENNQVEERIYSMYVRDLSIESNQKVDEHFFESCKSCHKVFFHGIRIEIIKLQQIYDEILWDLQNNGGREIYEFKNYNLDCNTNRTHETEIQFSNGTVIAIP